MTQRLKFGHVAVFDLVDIFNGLDLDWDFQIWRKIEKRGLGVIMHKHCSSASSFFPLFLNYLIKGAVKSRAITSTSLKYVEAERWRQTLYFFKPLSILEKQRKKINLPSMH